ncbi:hypothetical protein ONZ51_g9257 [Trametes cubensis]|uniref:Uncharacterized protein n=1 Tax=Trametes cubensis TaxID=1111947 RepID=A0AAD7TP81_9APHY|nr:hypothetical protein ONZ51_g9257 [Trametes cubensis]
MLHRGLEVWIAYTNGERIPEYEVQVDAEDKRKMTCTIPSDAGKASRSTSAAHASLADLGEHRVGISTRVDGVRVGSNACSPGQKGKRVGVRTVSADTYQMFQFATVFTMGSYHIPPSLSLPPSPSACLPRHRARFDRCLIPPDTEGEAFLGARPAAHRRPEKLGTIQLRVHHVQPVLGPSLPFRPHAVNLGGVVASAPDDDKDKTEKFATFDRHCVRLGKGLKRAKAQVDIPQASALDKNAGPFATFVFRLVLTVCLFPSAALQADGIMPLSEAKNLADEDSSDDDEDEYDEVDNVNNSSRSRFAKYNFAALAKACLRRAKRGSTDARQSWSGSERY